MDQHRLHLSRDLIKRRRRDAFGEEIKFQEKGQPTDLGGARQLAKNGRAQGVPSDSIVFTVPAAPAAKAETAPARTPLAEPASNGNGKANGTRSVTPAS